MLSLLAPNYAEIDTLWRNPLPFALWPVGPQSLLAHWMDEAVRLGLAEVKIYASDRPAEIRRHLEGGAYWSCKVEVIPLREDSAVPAGAVRMDHLPGRDAAGSSAFTPEELLRHWLALQSEWLRGRESGAVHVDIEQTPGGWLGPRAAVHPGAKLVAPYWIGANAKIGPGCEIGPNAFIGANSVLDGAVQVCDGAVAPGTFLGQNLRVSQALAQAGLLVDIRRGCRVEIRENFILSSVARHRAGPNLLDRAAALAAWLALAPLALLWPEQEWIETEIDDPDGGQVLLKTGVTGPLIVRRWPWLKRIAAGDFRWFGILPREDADWEHMPAETARLLRGTRCGLFSWADLEGCHDAGAPDEWIHAAYQVIQKEKTVPRTLRRHFFQLALRPL